MGELAFGKVWRRDDGAFSGGDEQSRLWRWVGLSGILHSAAILIVLFVPGSPYTRNVSYPVYSVELVGGEKLGGSGGVSPVKAREAGKERKKAAASQRTARAKPVKPRATAKKVEPVKPPAPPIQAKRLRKVTPPSVALAKKTTPTAPQKQEPVKKKVPQPLPQSQAVVATVTGEAKNKKAQEAAKEVVAKKEDRAREGLSEHLREKLIQAALDRVKRRAEKSKDGEDAGSGGGITDSGRGSGDGSGDGAQAYGEGGRGGGVLKGIEFLVYRNQMLNLIKQKWAWVGRNPDLKVTVHFGVLDNGEIAGLQIVQSSGDATYDESVLRAMRKAAPLPPPPDSYRKDFMDVELTFKPSDLRG